MFWGGTAQRLAAWTTRDDDDLPRRRKRLFQQSSRQNAPTVLPSVVFVSSAHPSNLSHTGPIKTSPCLDVLLVNAGPKSVSWYDKLPRFWSGHA